MKTHVGLASFGVLAVLIGSTWLMSGTAVTAQQRQVFAETRGQKASSGADPNIIEPKALNELKPSIEAPPNKGGSATRGGSVIFNVDNRTALAINVYANGRFVASVAPYGDAYLYFTPGYISLYARAEFVDGSALAWGPAASRVGPGAYIWTLQ